jgi:cobalt-zinc-cadmium efflux system outer membrane protein
MRGAWRHGMRCAMAMVMVTAVVAPVRAQARLTWPEIVARFEAANPTVLAGRIGLDESRAAEITAFLRPNPQLSVTMDQLPIVGEATYPLENLLTVASATYLHERRHKRELRRDSAQGATAVAESTQADLIRTLLFTVRGAFVQILQATAFQTFAQENLASYDQVLSLSQERLRRGDIAQVDFDRLQLQRVQYESDVQTALVNLRTAKIQLLRLLNDRTPVDQFEVSGVFDFRDPGQPLDALRQTALGTRPDLAAARRAVDKAATDHRLALANGSVDPTIGVDVGRQQTPATSTPPLSIWAGVTVGVPLRIFDRNQGEKLRTALEIKRSEQSLAATRAQVIGDVDAGYATVISTLGLLRPYKATYLDQATRVRDTVTFSYQRGGASLLEFLQAQQEYRAVRVSYVNLVAAFLNAVNQLNLAVGQEVIP